MNLKLILLERKRPTVYEVHIGEIRQAKNILFTTTNKEFAEQVVNSFNNYNRIKKQLHKAKNDLGVKDILISQISKASKEKISELNKKVLNLEKNK